MRLNKDKGRQSNNKALIKKQSNHLKSTSMDNIPSSSRTKNIYLNKILQKNLGNNKLPLKGNIIQNFQTSIQNIFSNDEKRQKAKNYVLNLRSKNNNQSQYSLEDDYLSKNKNNYFSKSNYGEFYNKNNTIRKTYELLDDYNDNDNYNNYRSSQKERHVNMRNILDNSPEIKNGFIKVNKINKYNDEIRYFGNANNNNTYNKNNNLLSDTKQALNKNNIKYNTNLENHFYLNSQSDIKMNNSGYNDLGQDLVSEFNLGERNYNSQNVLYEEGFKYNKVKSPIYYNENNKAKYSKGNINYNMNKNKTNTNFKTISNKGLYPKNINMNQKFFSKFNFKSEKKEENKKTEKKTFNNLKIEKNHLKTYFNNSK